MIDERSRERQHLTVSEGIARLREALRLPRQCVRLVGLSGVGKTRLVQALFEECVGEEPLDPSVAIYTDYSEETEPSAKNMARQLIAQKQRAIPLIPPSRPSCLGGALVSRRSSAIHHRPSPIGSLREGW
jgi:DNA polymerase III delta prime subunit